MTDSNSFLCACSSPQLINDNEGTITHVVDYICNLKADAIEMTENIYSNRLIDAFSEMTP